MFIHVAYKDAPELSIYTRRKSIMTAMPPEVDIAVEKTLLVNPNCPVRIMLEYIRKKCRLASMTYFDLCDETGGTKGLFSMPTYEYATDLFDHKKTYYLIVICKQESDKVLTVIPQVNRANRLYGELQARVRRFLLTGEISPLAASTKGTTPPPASFSKKKDK